MRSEWVVVADASRARIFARVDGAGWQDIRDLRRGTNGRNHNGREVRLPAGMQKLSNVAPAMEPVRDDFLERLARELKAARKRGDFDALGLVAPPDVLEALLDDLDAATRRTLTTTSSEDLIGLPVREARRALSRHF